MKYMYFKFLGRVFVARDLFSQMLYITYKTIHFFYIISKKEKGTSGRVVVFDLWSTYLSYMINI